jgi:transketolase
MLEDIGLMKMLPNMTVINPCDYNQTKMATLAAASCNTPVYLRFGRPAVPNFTPANQPFIIGKAVIMNEGSDVTLIATGHLVWHALEAAYQLSQQGISAEVINIHTIKPLDEEAILRSVAKTQCAVTAEEHQLNGGLGDSICQLLGRKMPAPVEPIAVMDTFGESGTPAELMTRYGLDTPHIIEAAHKVIARKKS